MKSKCLLFTQALLFWGHLLSKQSAVTYSGGDRFGDKLSVYCLAKWISYKYHIPLYYKPFDYSDRLTMHSAERSYNINIPKKFKKVIIIDKTPIHIEPDKGYFYDIGFYAPTEIDWNDRAFINELKKFIKPVDTIRELKLPTDCITVAIHVRKGSGPDAPLLSDNKVLTLPRYKYSDVIWPTKFPPDTYYIEQLQKISEIFKDQKIYAFIFTDHNNPRSLVKKYKAALKNNNNIVLDCHKNKELYFERILDDFFSLSKFDCLIRSSSRFSLIASKFGNYKVQVWPGNYHWEGNTLIMEGHIELNL